MSKTILITGATDGIGLATATMLAPGGHTLLLHGRNLEKLERVEQELSALTGCGPIHTCRADLSRLGEVEALAEAVAADHARLDVLVNNAGVFRVSETSTPEGLDVRFVVNTIAPYVLTRRLLPRLDASGRVVNLSSAAQAAVDLAALTGERRLSDMDAYAQSKLALTMWSRHLGLELGDAGPVIVAVNPGSMLGTKMVRDAFGSSGSDVGIGAKILVRAALSEDFAAASGAYFDNDQRSFGAPHPDALDPDKCEAVVRTIRRLAGS